MFKAPKNNAQAFSVDEVALRVRKLIQYDPDLSSLTVEGELSELKRHSSGHVYFSLKGEKASLPCVMFRSDAAGMLLWPQTGDRVLVQGRVDFYAERGTVQIYVRKMYPVGLGAAARAKEELRRKLEREGLFSDARKRALPAFPSRVACVTSPTGAAIRDVMSVFRRRYPAAELIVVPCLVQGIQAPESIASALLRAARIPNVQAILLVRGGGSRDDLNPFDDEDVVRALACLPVPVISGVGHEVDWSLCDLAADLRVPTPTAAAEAVFPDIREILSALRGAETRLSVSARARSHVLSSDLSALESGIGRSCVRTIRHEMQTLDLAEEGLEGKYKRGIEDFYTRLGNLERSLDALSPYSLSARGYALCCAEGVPVKSIQQIMSAAHLTVQFTDGDAACTVDKVTQRV